ncbi:MAG: glycosyltransferase family 39 protein [Candidatus Aenigmatarchaeota archaeon]
MKMDKRLCVILLIVILTVALRLYSADRFLINDEITWITPAKNIVASGFPSNPIYCGVPGGYFYIHPPMGLILYSTTIASAGVEFVRLVPIIFGLLSILLTYFLGKKLFDDRTALIAAGMMAISSYHIIASQIIDVDGAILAFFNLATILSFVLYKKNLQKRFLFFSGLFLILSLFTKMSGFLVIIPILVYSYALDRNFRKTGKELIFFIVCGIIFLGALYGYASIAGQNGYFTEPVNYLMQFSGRGSSPSIQNVLLDKAFYVATASWQMTPFLLALLLLALFKKNRDSNYWLLVSWILTIVIIFMMPYGGAFERYFTTVLPAVFIFIASFLSRINLNKKIIIPVMVISFLLAAIFGISDVLGYYNPLLIAAVYVVAFAMLIPRKREQLLLGAFAGLSLFLVIGMATWPAVESNLVKDITEGVDEFGFPHNETYANQDIDFYLTPKDETPQICFPELTMDYMKNNNITYLAVYGFRDELKLKSLAQNCLEKREIFVSGRLAGLVCKLE